MGFLLSTRSRTLERNLRHSAVNDLEPMTKYTNPYAGKLTATLALTFLSTLCLGVLSACDGSGEPKLEKIPIAKPTETSDGAKKLISFQHRVAKYKGVIDATIEERKPDGNLGGSKACRADGDKKDGTDQACLIRWDVSKIPKGSTVDGVEMSFRVINGSSKKYSIHELLSPWVSEEVTWNSSTKDKKWETPGALGKTDRDTEVGTIRGKVGTRIATLNDEAVEMVQRWVDGENYGIVISDSKITNGLSITSSQGDIDSDRPKLTISYTK